MKSARTKRLVAGGFAVLLSLGIVLPTSASASSYVTKSANTTHTLDWSVYINEIDWTQIMNQIQGINGQVQEDQPSFTPPAAKPPASKPVQQQPSNAGAPAPKPSTNTPDSGSKQQAGVSADKSQFATQVISLVNQERSKAGLKPLAGEGALNTMALAKAKDMSQNNYFDHTSPTYGSPFDMMKKFNIKYSYAGENIAMGQKTPQEVVKAWMNSAGHRANILNGNFTLIGVGYYNGYWAQEFVGR
ncbi:CAP domain-containing protein [Paenibacillus caui]|uniref:CAP domain-containing protein n=1 Tax=Paenibacillus caui TaxID=2873927 RepID=UPI001CA91506|nr:CAP domain-containing protein [Paenibacillus caui]